MKHLRLLALIALSAACAPVDDAELPGTGANAEAATYVPTAPSCTSPTVCFDTSVVGSIGASCRTQPAPISCVNIRGTYEPSSKPSRSCLTATDCQRFDFITPTGNRAVAVNRGAAVTLQSWQNAVCGGAMRASNNVVTDDGATSGLVIIACCNKQCITRR